jgi:uncharacterized protein (TIGR02246 family)
MRRIFVAFCVVAALWSGDVRAETARAAIEAANKNFQEAFNRGDAGAVARMYTPDGAVLPPDAKRADGREAIQQFWQSAIDAGLRELSLRSIEVEEAGDTAYEVGTATLKAQMAGGTTVAMSLKYIVIWRRGADDVWRLHRDIWNANPAATAA